MATIATDEEWLAARRALLQEEKALQRARDQLAGKRRRLPWRRIESDYEFEGADGRRSLLDLFGNASQLLIYHFMYHPDWDQGCKTCSFWADGFDASIPRLDARDVTFGRNIKRAARETVVLPAAHGVAISMVLLSRQHVQLRLRRIFHSGANRIQE